jgi:hypothetical protein
LGDAKTGDHSADGSVQIRLTIFLIWSVADRV